MTTERKCRKGISSHVGARRRGRLDLRPIHPAHARRHPRAKGFFQAILPCQTSVDEIRKYDRRGIISLRWSNSVLRSRSTQMRSRFLAQIPVLGICYGMQGARMLWVSRQPAAAVNTPRAQLHSKNAGTTARYSSKHSSRFQMFGTDT